MTKLSLSGLPQDTRDLQKQIYGFDRDLCESTKSIICRQEDLDENDFVHEPAVVRPKRFRGALFLGSLTDQYLLSN